MAFHSRDGLYFARSTDGGVIVTIEVPVRDGMGGFADQTAVLHRIELPENEWGSVVAHVSRNGETSETWQQARDFHAGVSSAGGSSAQ